MRECQLKSPDELPKRKQSRKWKGIFLGVCLGGYVGLEQSSNVTGLGVQINVVESRTGGETRHGRHASDQGVDKVGTGRKSDLVDWQGESGGNTLFAGVI